MKALLILVLAAMLAGCIVVPERAAYYRPVVIL